MKKTINFKINDKEVTGLEGQTVLEVARDAAIDIPTLCYRSDLETKASCRICLIEIKGCKGLFTACSTKISEAMEVLTESPKISRARKINLELIFAQHQEECKDCVWGFHCRLLKLAKKYDVKICRFVDRKSRFPVYRFGSALIFDSTKCIDCSNCVDVCKKQTVNFLEKQEKDHLFHIAPTQDKTKDCTYCGQCIVHCPAGAFEGVGEFEEIEEPLREKDKVVIFQFAPSVGISIGEEFAMPYGEIVSEKLVAGIKKLGVDKVFDTGVGADFAAFEQADELLTKLEDQKTLPLFTSSCPAWVKFIEFYYPEFIPNLSSVRSPHLILGGLLKTYWAKKEKVDPKNVVVVSITPCVANKYEILRKELEIDGLKAVDYVLTARELVYLFHSHKIDFKNLKPQKPDNPFASPSGGGVIYGASGGGAESTLRTAYAKLVKTKTPKIEFKELRGMKGIKKTVIEIDNRKIKIAVVSGLGNARKIIEELKKEPKRYDFVEVMACFGGCVGGGGQPVPIDSRIRRMRAEALYKIDRKKEIRAACEDPILEQSYKDYLRSKKIIDRVCRTSYAPKRREVKFKN